MEIGWTIGDVGRQLQRSRGAKVGIVIVSILIFMAIFADLISPYSYYDCNPEHSMRPPSRTHIFGTDRTGRDVFSRVIYGVRISLCVGCLASVISLMIGLFLGTISGFSGGWWDRIIMRFVDIMLSFPSLLLAIGISYSLGPSLLSIFIALGCVGWASFARLCRGVVLSIRESTFIDSAIVLGCSKFRIIFRHILPNCIPIMIVVCSLKIGTFILAEAGLSFLGLGAQPPTPSWGEMVSSGKDFIRVAPWMSLFPGAFIAIAVLGFNLLGDGLRDLLDPRLKSI
jgi:ABC-type dipeptide/oligopeptide/nickel transport system permease subunit